MNLSHSALECIDKHWALSSIGDDNIKKAHEIAQQIFVNGAVGEQINFNFNLSEVDKALLKKIAFAYELASIEGIKEILNPTSVDKKLREQFTAGAYRAFDFLRLMPFPESKEQKIFHVLHLSALAYCGERWTDLRRWYKENESLTQPPSVANAEWDIRLLNRLYDCWIRLFRKKGWDDLDKIREIVAGLREDQNIYEADLLQKNKDVGNRNIALRLVSLYHWAKATELIAVYMLQGEAPGTINTLLDKHFDAAIRSAIACADSQLEILLQWLHVSSYQMIKGSVWWVAKKINSRVTKFVKEITKKQAMFELLPPQRAAIQEQGLLDQAVTAVVVDMPTSGGKTLLAEFRILQALNQFDNDENGKGWVAYVAPTKALTSQITRRLRKDFEPIGIKVEQMTSAIEIDTFEEDLLAKTEKDEAFDVLVATPEKLQLIIRNKKIPRPLALVVMDEAHNIENETRGLRIELLLATIKGECDTANFLLLMPFVEKPEILAQWLAQDINAGRAISLGTTPWKPNDRIVGMFKAVSDDAINAGWRLEYQTLLTSPNTIYLKGKHNFGKIKPLKIPKSKALGSITLQTAAAARVMSDRGTTVAIANNTNWVWNMARETCKTMQVLNPLPEEIKLVQNFLKTEISNNFELIQMLNYGIGVHHSGLSDEVRALIEWLAEEGTLKILFATTTIAQGINFPVSSVFLATNKYPYGKEMSPREFWNLAGRAGRIGQDSVGVVGIAEGNNSKSIVQYVAKTTGELISQLVKMLDDLDNQGQLNNLELVLQNEQWDDFRCYIAHLWNEKKDLDIVLSNTEQLLRNTFGYGILQSKPEYKKKADKLLEVTRNYVKKLASNPGIATLADSTGFSPEGIAKAMVGMNSLENKLSLKDWQPDSLFGKHNGMADLYGIMLKIPQLKNNLEEITGKGDSYNQIANITNAWVNGQSIEEIANEFFDCNGNITKSLTNACRAIYKVLVNNGTWGFSALSQLPNSGLDYDNLSEEIKRKINILPAMIYPGVKTEEAVLLRMNSVPRSIAESMGKELKNTYKEQYSSLSLSIVKKFLKESDINLWDKVKPKNSSLSGKEYRQIWKILSGEIYK